ncbi:Ankyrin repeat and SAM domain-containing protein [Actinidia chinensis var. chinensis]|uniref:Ankyrin repeat and SAM domain-containing protein n=1 Tax=Actinidia chinensis var. chinensis TaxID=1590841 RepID=A0A2R6RF66_ACTCC|nr:Ankyrin repeat and SAM domain-containing protein [Actinidia chinensis var. chinensis]
MAETSRSRVTITLGGSGQVVKRGGAVANSGFSHSQAALGSKRSVRDRLGSDVDGIQLNSKRQRGDSNGVDDARLGKDDLRFKLMRQNVKRRGQTDVQRNGVDLRETLSRAVQPPTTSLSMHQRLPEPMDSRYLVPERKDTSILGRIPPTRSADAFPRMDSLRNSYSPWTLDQLKKRSPDRVLRTSRNLSPQRNEEEITKRPLIRTNDEARTFSYMNRDILEPGRALGTAPYSTRTIAAGASVKHVVPLPALSPPSNGIVHKTLYSGNEHRTVDGLLHYLGLEKYAISFKAEEVDMAALKQMGDSDLKALGIPMGPRKKILFALLPRSKRPSG